MVLIFSIKATIPIQIKPHVAAPPTTVFDIPELRKRLSYTERHNGIDNVIVVFFERLHSLLPRHRGLGHDQFDILSLKARIIDFLTIVFFLLLLGFRGIDALALDFLREVDTALGLSTTLAGVLGGSKLLSGGCLCLGVQILDLGLTEDASNLSAYTPGLYVGNGRLTSMCCWLGICRHQAG